MSSGRMPRWSAALFGAVGCLLAGCNATEQFVLFRPWFNEQQTVVVRDPESLPRAAVPQIPPPRTVTEPGPGGEPWHLSLDEAIRTALQNSEVVRVLGGVTASSSGSTIYDVSIANTAVDEARATFDPVLTAGTNTNHTEQAAAGFDPLDPMRAVIGGGRTDNQRTQAGVSQRLATGTDLDFSFTHDANRRRPGDFPLNPEQRTATQLTLTQPLRRGFGTTPNLAPMVIARLQTEQSWFQFKDSVQRSVASVIDGYWSLVAARTNRWARRQQVEQSEFALERAEARFEVDFANSAEVAQTRVALSNFRAALVTAEAQVLDAEAALRNVMGLPPEDRRELIPTTPPIADRLAFDWEALLELAEQRRPDIIELKLVLEADQERLALAENQAQAQVDAVAQYRWNGLEGRMRDHHSIAAPGGAYTDWTLGVNFSVPLGLRQGRAGVRRQELLVARDRANLNQGIHAAVHSVALTVRQQASSYAQYAAYRTARQAARINLEQQFAEYRSGRAIFLNVLSAIADWGNAVTAEAQALTTYNALLADLEYNTGTILETHGIWFFEEREANVAPLGKLGRGAAYSRALHPTGEIDRYRASPGPAEEVFELRTPVELRAEDEPPPANREEPGPAPAPEPIPPEAPPPRSPPAPRGRPGPPPGGVEVPAPEEFLPPIVKPER